MFHFISSFFERFSFADSTLPDSPVPSGTLGHFGDTPWGVSEPSVFNGWGLARNHVRGIEFESNS